MEGTYILMMKMDEDEDFQGEDGTLRQVADETLGVVDKDYFVTN